MLRRLPPYVLSAALGFLVGALIKLALRFPEYFVAFVNLAAAVAVSGFIALYWLYGRQSAMKFYFPSALSLAVTLISNLENLIVALVDWWRSLF